MQTIFREPTDEEYTDLASMWIAAEQMIHRKYNYKLQQSTDDLLYLQRALDDGLINSSDNYQLRSIGMIFGRAILSHMDGYDWWVVSDEYGKEYVVRFGETSLQIDAINMIGKRVEDGESIDVLDLFNGLIAKLKEVQSDFR